MDIIATALTACTAAGFHNKRVPNLQPDPIISILLGWTKPSVSHHYKGGEEGAGGSSFLRKTRKEEDVKF